MLLGTPKQQHHNPCHLSCNFNDASPEFAASSRPEVNSALRRPESPEFRRRTSTKGVHAQAVAKQVTLNGQQGAPAQLMSYAGMILIEERRRSGCARVIPCSRQAMIPKREDGMERISENSNGLVAGEVRPEQTDPARREVLTTIGRFAYVAPALVLLAEPKFAHAGYGRGGGDGGGSFGGDGGGSFGSGGDGGSSGGGGGNGGYTRHRRRHNSKSFWKSLF
jgi:uncharacterized membrane protein YgcG